jgi:hypothetical protein
MKQIKLHFPNSDYLTRLLNDDYLAATIHYLNPRTTANKNTLLLFEDEEYHNNDIDTEGVILAIFAEAFNRIIFPGTGDSARYINPFPDQFKIGLINNGEILIDNIEITEI